MKDEKTIDAVIRQLEIIGEAANNISVEFHNTHPELPWSKMISMRNRLIHEYFGVWGTYTEDLSSLKKQIEELSR